MTETHEPRQASARFALLALVALLAASLALIVHPWFDRTHDGSVYVLTARSLLAGEGYSWLGIPFRVRPPGFSLLIAPVLALRGLDFQALNLLVGGTGVAAAALLFVLARPRLGTGLAWLVALALWLTPTWQRCCSQVMSDVPGLAAILACLVVERWAARRPSLARDLVLGVCIGAAAWVRFLAILLVPAVWLARGLAHRAPAPRQTAARARPLALACLPLGLAAALTIAPWQVRNALVDAPIPAEQTLSYSYTTGLLHADEGDPRSRWLAPSELLARVPARATELAAALGSRLRASVPSPARTAVAAALLGALGWIAWKRREAPELFAWLTLGLLVVYFAFEERLALPIYALALPAAVETARDVAARFLSAAAARRAAGALLVLFAAGDVAWREDWPAIERDHAAFRAFAREVERRLPPDARLAAGLGWHHALYLDRPVYSLRYAARRANDPAAAAAVIERHGIDALVLYDELAADRAFQAWAVERYGAQNAERVGEQGWIVHVRRPPRALGGPPDGR